MNKKITIATATALSLPLLVGCGQADTEASASSSAGSSISTESSSPVAQTAQGSGVADPTEGTDTAAPSEDPASTEAATGEATSDAGALPAVEDPCAGQCMENGRIPVDHPKFGAMEVVAYFNQTSEDGAAPSTGNASYALYQDGTPVGYVGTEGEVVHFGTSPALPGQTWDLANGSNVDKYGNVYLSFDRGVTVLTPTDEGYNSHGSLPQPEGVGIPFDHAGLKIDETGEPTILQKTFDKDGVETDQIIEYTWEGNSFAPVR